MPHLVQMDKRNRKKGLVIIGAEVQRSSDDDIKKIVDDHDVEFTITKGVQGPAFGSGIPRAVVFDATGKVVFTGHPADDKFERAVKDALRELKKSGGVSSEKTKSNLPAKQEPLIALRTWTNSEGKSIKAAVLSADAEQVKFKLSNGKTTNYPISQLSEDDQTVIKEAVEEAGAEDGNEE
jgi:hypothetical protein